MKRGDMVVVPFPFQDRPGDEGGAGIALNRATYLPLPPSAITFGRRLFLI